MNGDFMITKFLKRRYHLCSTLPGRMSRDNHNGVGGGRVYDVLAMMLGVTNTLRDNSDPSIERKLGCHFLGLRSENTIRPR